MKCPCGHHAACVPGCALMDYPGYTVEVEDDGWRTAYPEMPYSPELPDVTRTEWVSPVDPAPVTELVDEIDEWYAANDPLMAGAGDGNSPPWTEKTLLDDILEQRGSRYGRFRDNAEISQALKVTIHEHPQSNFAMLAADQQEALDQFACKISRLLVGDPDYVDNWDDIAGYAKLVAERLREEQA